MWNINILQHLNTQKRKKYISIYLLFIIII